MLRPVTQESVTQVVVDQLVRLIQQTPLRPGDKLPSEKELMLALNVSRPTVREALRVLNAMGLTESRRGQGTFVRHVRPESAIRSAVLSMLLLKEDLEEIQYARKLIEAEIAALMVSQAEPDDYRAMDDVLARMEAAVQAGTSSYDGNWEFHRTLAHIAGNGVLATLVDVLYRMIRELQLTYYQPFVDPQEELDAHRRLLEQLKHASPEQARRLMCDHLDAAQRVMLAAMAHRESS